MPTFAVQDQFWTGETGRLIKKAGKDAQILAIYLITNNEANKIGLYYLGQDKALRFLAVSAIEFNEAMQALIAIGFCDYDDDTGMVFIYNMAGHQIGFNLKMNDNKIIGVHNLLKSYPKNDRLVKAFVSHNQHFFHIPAEGNDIPEIPRNDQQKFNYELGQMMCRSPYVDKLKYTTHAPMIKVMFEANVSPAEILDTARVLYEKKGRTPQAPNLIYAVVVNARQHAADMAKKIHAKSDYKPNGLNEPARMSEADREIPQRNYDTNIRVI